jgi:integrase
MKVAELRKRNIIPVLERIEKRGSHNQANQAYRRLHSVLDFAAKRDLIDANPMANMEPIGKIGARDRVLTDEEIRTFWNWKGNSKEMHDILKLILVTGARPGEATGINASEITVSKHEQKNDKGKVIRRWEETWWEIPDARSKTKFGYRIFLTETAKTLLPAIKFSIELTTSVDHYLRRAINAGTLPIPAFTPHDLRRTQATRLGDLGFLDEVINACQGRQKSGVIKVYNKAEYTVERQAAAEAWERKLKAILAGTNDNVVPMTRKRRKAS